MKQIIIILFVVSVWTLGKNSAKEIDCFVESEETYLPNDLEEIGIHNVDDKHWWLKERPSCPAPKPDKFICKIKGLHYPDPNNCRCYFECDLEYRPFQLCCKRNQRFDTENLICVFENEVKCNGRKNPAYDCPRMNGEFPHKNCSKHWQCSKWMPIEVTCNDVLEWNQKDRVCDWPANVDCRATHERTTQKPNIPVGTTETSNTPVRTTETSNTPVRTTETSITPVRTTETSNTPVRTTETSITPVRTTETSNTPVRTTETSNTPVRTTETSNTSVRTTETSNTPVRTTETSNTPVSSTENPTTSDLTLECPISKIIYPCTCIGRDIECSGQEYFNLKGIFIDLSKILKNPEENVYNNFIFSNTAINEFEENTFSDIHFTNIIINNATNLTKIHLNAFESISSTLKSFDCNPCDLENFPPKFNLFNAINGLNNAIFIEIRSVNLKTIPHDAFKSSDGTQKPLKKIILGNSIESIEDYAFYDLHNLEWIKIHGNIQHLSSNAFNFRIASDIKLNLFLDNLNLKGSSFGYSSFTTSKRPLELFLFNNRIEYIDENVFRKFFQINGDNIVDFENNPLNCSNCRSFWLSKEKDNLMDRLFGAKCSDGQLLWDGNFDKCSDIFDASHHNALDN